MKWTCLEWQPCVLSLGNFSVGKVKALSLAKCTLPRKLVNRRLLKVESLWTKKPADKSQNGGTEAKETVGVESKENKSRIS